MWFKYFKKESWNLRIFRKANLFFNQDDFGMFRHKGLTQWKDFVFRMARTEGNLRGCNFFIGAGILNIIMYAKTTYYDPKYTVPKQAAAKIELDEKDDIARRTVFFNRFGAPTRPLRTMEDMMVFLAGSAIFDQLADFVSYNGAMDINMDIQKGLDSWMSEEDKTMLVKYQQHLKANKGGH